MFEVKCDVQGCGERETLFNVVGGGAINGLPPGWRFISYEEKKFAPKADPMKKALQAISKTLPAEMREAATEYLGAIMAASPAVVSSGPFDTLRFIKHMCPKHEITFVDDAGGDGNDDVAPGNVEGGQ